MDRIQKAIELARAQRSTEPPMPTTGNLPADRTPPRLTYTRTRVIDVSPRTWRDQRVVLGDADDAVTRSYKMLRTQVLQRMRENAWNALAVVSPGVSEGKSLTAVNLALSLAREVRHTVLLVDLDLRQPRLHRFFGYEPEHGLSDYLANGTPLSDILFNPGVERLVVLPSAKPMTDSSETLSSPRLTQLVEELKRRYPTRIVLFDLPPLLTTDDALVFSPYADSALLVVEEGKTRREDITRAFDLLKTTPVLGTVLNKART